MGEEVVAVMVASRPDQIGPSHPPPHAFGKGLFLNFRFECNKRASLNRLIRFCTTEPDDVIKNGSN